MKIYAISPEREIPGEIEILYRLFEDGLEAYHLRRPDESAERIEGFLERLPDDLRARTVLHQTPELVERYSLRGYHWKDVPGVDSVMRKGRSSAGAVRTSSRSLHSLKNWENSIAGWDYVFLSPVFPSIAKPGYCPSWTSDELREVLARPKPTPTGIAALGGVDATRIREARGLGFDAVVLHGALWKRERADGFFGHWKEVAA